MNALIESGTKSPVYKPTPKPPKPARSEVGMNVIVESGTKTPVVHPESHAEPAPKRPSLFRLMTIAVLVVAVFAALGVAGMRAKVSQQTERDFAAVSQNDKPRVLTTKAERASVTIEQLLPGNAAPLLETAMYARTSGYLKRWLVDIGDQVKEGQLLAEIETPEVDAQLLQARAALAESRATLVRNKASAALARLNLDRIRQAVERSVSSQQDFDATDAALKVSEATVQASDAVISANEANVKRLEDLQQFQKVVAPFSGVVTARNYDPGALIVADNAAAKELFHLARVDTIRVFVDVPQTLSTAVKVGRSAQVFRREASDREFTGTVARTTNSLDPRTRTLRVEVHVPNEGGALMPGMYLQVRFKLDTASGVVRVPGAAIITRAEGTRVAVLDAQNILHYQAVKIGRDFGTQVEIVGGLTGGETIVLRPGDDMADATVVEPVSAGGR